jgi:hypothetical protein
MFSIEKQLSKNVSLIFSIQIMENVSLIYAVSRYTFSKKTATVYMEVIGLPTCLSHFRLLIVM